MNISPVTFLIGLAGMLVIACATMGQEGGPDTKPGDAGSASNAASSPVVELMVHRVGGDKEIQAEQRGEFFHCGTASVTTPLPEGYPPPTPPGAIEIKRYPLVRRAQVSREGGADWGMNGAFWPLFRHIQSRDIEMTSPVEIDYAGMTDDPKSNPESWTMSFLYRRIDQGPVGPAHGQVEVVDVPPMTVVAVGFQGDYSIDRVRLHLRRLTLWLDEHDDQWEQAGDPRSMYYNGPEQRSMLRWGEVQIPVRAKPEAATAPSTDAEPDPAPASEP